MELRMPFSIVVGAQWGDEGKGRIVDLLAENADYVARYSGGDNAGHTVNVKGENYKLHLLPSGIIHPQTITLLGNGMVINPAVLLNEIEQIRSAGIQVSPERVFISHAAHIITPGHIALDAGQERLRGKDQIGTTQRGIGPAYTSKVSRSGLRMEDMLSTGRFKEKLEAHLNGVNQQLSSWGEAKLLPVNEILRDYSAYAEILSPYITDVSLIANQALETGKEVLAEGAQGTLLDLDHGTYPFVTSSSPIAPGALIGLGLGVGSVDKVIGVVKAFQTRVGEGPFPTELFGDAATRLRGTGENDWDEFGTTTGRPRRVGWLDAVLLRYSIRINGITEIALTKLDILTGFEILKICTGYQVQSDILTDLPLGPTNISKAKPVFEELPGWEEELGEIRSWKKLPKEAMVYIARIEEITEKPVKIVSIGPERSQVILR
jgi:adenylosuccinate synthase